ncbi:hypothetical protein BU15DRAFT_66368 [Melanogaster broomeanus]|nr:hypothetical protein BU15DRAFT_66368 [Melanogaster broomeanus]
MACKDALTLGAQIWFQVGGMIEVISLVLYLRNNEIKVLADLLDEKQTDVKSLINYLTAAIILARVKMADLKAKISVPAFDIARTAIGIPHDGQNFKWKNLLDNLLNHQCYILDYPSEFTIKLWPEEYKCWVEKEDQQQLDIPLVVSTD